VKIKSTGISNKSTGGGNHSSTGSDESIKHDGDQEEKFTRMSVPKGNPGKVAIKPEWSYDNDGSKGLESGQVGKTGFKGQDAAHETICKC